MKIDDPLLWKLIKDPKRWTTLAYGECGSGKSTLLTLISQINAKLTEGEDE